MAASQQFEAECSRSSNYEDYAFFFNVLSNHKASCLL